MTDWVLYILACGQEQHYYTGITNDLPKRLAYHKQRMGCKYTRSKWPHISFKFSVTCKDKSEALRLEHRVKKLSRKQKEEFMRMEGDVWDWLLHRHAPRMTRVGKEQDHPS